MKNVTLNLNGDEYGSLMAELQEARRAVTAAQEALNKLTVHGRNYLDHKTDDPSTDRRAWSDFKADIDAKRNHVENFVRTEEWIVECMLNLIGQYDRKSPKQGSAKA